jgi:hypothetical protein
MLEECSSKSYLKFLYIFVGKALGKLVKQYIAKAENTDWQ